ncbi:MAG: sulfide/dihydroorotate dehydrogenase-like FAD/NAD-binding protein, partial [Treponema sp.]|nr:sulfide/dihydroorotate dehydrogenase-like FAD/NAD-binding protein [Treponema sp.]
IAIVFQAVGATTYKLSKLKAGDYLAGVLGPLGTPSNIQKYDAPVVCVGGGIGTAPLYPIVQALKDAGNKVYVIIAARNKDLLIFVDEMKAVADQVFIMTDDGSAGEKGVATIPLERLCQEEVPPAEVIAIGPPIMMKFACATTKKYNVKTTVSLNTIMIDGTGMCGGCRVSVGGKTKFVCVDGPDFDGHEVDWNNMMTRMKSFKKQELEADHKCNLEVQAGRLVQMQAASK